MPCGMFRCFGGLAGRGIAINLIEYRVDSSTRRQGSVELEKALRHLKDIEKKVKVEFPVKTGDPKGTTNGK